jgi:hypothetical protein
MEDLRIRFIDECYNDAITLKEQFKITESKDWDIITVLLELGVQIGHIFDIECNTGSLKEPMRNIHELGDEVSDVLLQTMYLGYLAKVDFKRKIDFEYYDINGIMVLYGQLVETIMEENSYRFKKERVGFDTRLDFIKDRILKIYLLTINYAKENNINVIEEFKKMKKDAEGFLREYEKKHRM